MKKKLKLLINIIVICMILSISTLGFCKISFNDLPVNHYMDKVQSIITNIISSGRKIFDKDDNITIHKSIDNTQKSLNKDLYNIEISNKIESVKELLNKYEEDGANKKLLDTAFYEYLLLQNEIKNIKEMNIKINETSKIDNYILYSKLYDLSKKNV